MQEISVGSDPKVQVSVVIPNYNGINFIGPCLDSLKNQTFREFSIILVDNASSDGSYEYVKDSYPYVKLLRLDKNYGFPRAVNEGIKASTTPFVILLNNDTEVHEEFVEKLLYGIKKSKRLFSCGSKILKFHDRNKIDDAGGFYSALGWAYARGKGQDSRKFTKVDETFFSCAGGAIYRKSVFEEIGYFDEEFFAYLEDVDIGYRARIQGYKNIYCPSALVYHVGSGTSGSRYNSFKVKLSSRNNIVLIYKNMPLLQLIINLPLLIPGFFIKTLFFIKKGMGREYLTGIKNGFSMCKKEKKVKFSSRNIRNYVGIQLELWKNLILR